MDKDLELAQIKNLVIKTKIVMIFFAAVLVLQIAGISVLRAQGILDEVPIEQVVLVPTFILLVILDEYFILRYLNKCTEGKKKFSDRFKYLVSFLEITYPAIVLYFGSVMLMENDGFISTFMFLNSPPFIVYFIILVLTAFYFDIKISILTGLVGTLQYVFINYFLLENGSFEFSVNLSKAPFIMAVAIVSGYVGKRLKQSVLSALEAKNILINELDLKVAERTEEVENQKKQLSNQFDLLQERNKEITDSIVYAKRIQSAILPPEKLIKEKLPNSFVLYKPKDIVAGDFYWLQNKGDKVLFAAADCTGHGVPGALVSVVCNNGLNRSVREYGLLDTGKILDKTRDVVLQEFEKSVEGVSDGMDIALCCLSAFNKDLGTAELQYSGAHNPLWIIRKNADTIEEIKALKQPIGMFDNPQPYPTHSINLKKGDSFYIFSDGYVDQFGGEKGKKFKASNFKKLLLSIQNESISAQKTIIEDEFEKWRGTLEQLDDVCVIGVQI
jgi:serine phosphatase RsbU (regulator of sigma subunit)